MERCCRLNFGATSGATLDSLFCLKFSGTGSVYDASQSTLPENSVSCLFLETAEYSCVYCICVREKGVNESKRSISSTRSEIGSISGYPFCLCSTLTENQGEKAVHISLGTKLAPDFRFLNFLDFLLDILHTKLAVVFVYARYMRNSDHLIFLPSV